MIGPKMIDNTQCNLYPNEGVGSLRFGKSPETIEIWQEFTEAPELSKYSGDCIVYVHPTNGMTVYVCAGVIDRILLTKTCLVEEFDLIGSTVKEAEVQLGYRAIADSEIVELTSDEEAVFEISELGIQLWASVESSLVRAVFADAGI